MTIALCLKVADGLVFGADSASTVRSRIGVSNVYRNAEKVFNLRKELPVAAVTYGLGGLGGRSVSSLAKDLRAQFTDLDDPWYLDPDTYTLEEVAGRVKEYFIDDLYMADFDEAEAEFERLQEEGEIEEDEEFTYTPMGFLIGGFSHDAVRPEVWKVEVDQTGTCEDPSLLYDRDDVGQISWRGQQDPLWRLIMGHSLDILDRIKSVGVEEDVALNLLTSVAPLASPAMPIKDAVDLVEFLATVAAGYARFAPGAPAVTPPIDIGTVTLHERFRWVQRKHYFPSELNLKPGRFDPYFYPLDAGDDS